jgi:hypothetical protein
MTATSDVDYAAKLLAKRAAQALQARRNLEYLRSATESERNARVAMALACQITTYNQRTEA